MTEKIFHDTVHGDVFVSSDYCSKFIDTILFQRLRRIEQTSMRALYPCARHDRFIHSLGVFHLGRKFANNIQINTKNQNNQFWISIEPYWKKVEESYKIACLLHDIGHSPFSHTFEHYFDLKSPKLTERLNDLVNEVSFSSDIRNTKDTKPHEKISAYIAYKIYKDEIEFFDASSIYVVRMILGVIYLNPESTEQKLVNCFIPLLHGSIDVDRLDYACRDQWASGFSSARINLNRILCSGLLIEKNKQIHFCYNKNAVSQFQSLIDIKNYQKTWVFGHQKVQYDQFLLKKSIDILAENSFTEYGDKDEVLNKIFNIDVFFNVEYQISNTKIYLLSDDDLIHLIKQSLHKNDYAKEWFSRTHERKPLWKTESQYLQLFENFNRIDESKIKGKIDVIEEKFNISLSAIVIKYEKNLDCILKHDVKLFLNETLVEYCDLKYNKSHTENNCIHYVYINSNHYENYKDKIIDELKLIQ